MARASSKPPQPIATQHIIDIRNGADFVPLVDQIRQGLNVPEGQEKKLPTLLLYDKRGLQLFEKITYLDEYYLTNQEIEVLEQNAPRIAERIALQPDSIVLELGSGNLRKVRLLLDALDKKGFPVSYYALDLSREELERTLAEIPPGTFQHVKCFGLLGTYDDGLAWLKQPKNIKRPKTVLHLGSSIGNFNRKEGAEFLAQFGSVLSGKDSFLLGVDACTNADKVYHAYNDRFGLTHEFVLNGLQQANELLGHQAFDLADWKVIGEYDAVAGRHHAFVSPSKDVVVEGVFIKADERVRIEESYKYDRQQRDALLEAAGMIEGARWTNMEGDYGLHLLNRPRVSFPVKPEQYAANPVPTLEEFRSLWTAWDAVTRDMISDDELLDKPIKLRNACIFYLGHIPAFMDIHLTRATGSDPTEPAHFHQMFERGIDPDVDDPTKCHMHSEIPDNWPELSRILDYQAKVRDRIQKLYVSGLYQGDGAVARALWISFEHEAMHLETLLYMLVQSAKTLPPPGSIKPDFEAMAQEARSQAVPNEWFQIPAQEVTIGIDDTDDNSRAPHFFGWDNERPARKIKVNAFEIQARPITNGEFASFLEQTKSDKLPASWCELYENPNGFANGQTKGQTNGQSKIVSDGHVNGYLNGDSNGPSNGHSNGANGHNDPGPSAQFLHGKAVRTVYGLVPLKLALDWPVSASYDELSAVAIWKGGRIPTMEETRSAYQYAESSKGLGAYQTRSENIPAVNSHLVNDGVEESPTGKQSADGLAGPNPRDFFIDLTGTNTGFRHWHPVSVTAQGARLGGQCDMGGLWEWTSTTLTRHDGFEPMNLYPGYTADFFDDKHNIVLGGSWATAPRMAGRKSFVNWYQRNYPFVWAGARVARDAK